MERRKSGIKCLVIFLIGGFLYVGVELLFRGYSHISMFLTGGICFLLIGLLNEVMPFNISLISQMFLSSILITFVELIVGFIVNVWMKQNVWDYSALPYNFHGQICLLFTNLWFLLSFPGIILEDLIRYWLWGEERPKYRLF